MTKYIHYGHKEFDISKFKIPQNKPYSNKPFGGLWASKLNAPFGWKEWCKENEFRKCEEDNSFTFEIAENANIIYINKVADVAQLPDQDLELVFTNMKTIDFEQLMQNRVDVIEFNISSDWGLYMALYGWDCDSILILNPNIVKQ